MLKPASNPKEFEELATKFPKGTIFKDHGKGDWDGRDSYDTPNHGWMYRESVQDRKWKYCNLHDYILDYWQQYPHLFKFEEYVV